MDALLQEASASEMIANTVVPAFKEGANMKLTGELKKNVDKAV